jgi:chaperonin GroEL (HSP60 family)
MSRSAKYCVARSPIGSLEIQSTCSDIEEKHLGACGKFEERQIGGERFNIFEDCKSARLTSAAPPPATIVLFLIARLTIMIASCKLLSTSAINCSAPPRHLADLETFAE